MQNENSNRVIYEEKRWDKHSKYTERYKIVSSTPEKDSIEEAVRYVRDTMELLYLEDCKAYRPCTESIVYEVPVKVSGEVRVYCRGMVYPPTKNNVDYLTYRPKYNKIIHTLSDSIVDVYRYENFQDTCYKLPDSNP